MKRKSAFKIDPLGFICFIIVCAGVEIFLLAWLFLWDPLSVVGLKAWAGG